jgi:hypothetical protein
MVTPYVANWYSSQPQQDNLTASIQSLADQVARLQEAIDRLEQRLDDE